MRQQDDANGESHQREMTAAESMLRSMERHGVEYVFGDFGTDHTPLLEAAAHIREDDPEAMPETVVCPDEAIAIGMAHGYASMTGEPQVIVVHVDVGTQNLGAMLHNAHRASVPMFILAGLTPMTETGFSGSRDMSVHYVQQTFHQADIVREYTRWFHEFRFPEDPERVIVRGLERAVSTPPGPVYLTAAREPLEVPTSELESKDVDRNVRRVAATAPDNTTLDELAALIDDADAPLIVTDHLGQPPGEAPVETLVEFAEQSGAGVVEQRPSALNFPRDHDQHVGFDSTELFDETDLVIIADVDCPWTSSNGTPPADLPVVQIDGEPSKALYPHWDFQVDRTIQADPEATLSGVTDRLNAENGATGREHWPGIHEAQAEERSTVVSQHREDGRLTPEILTDRLADVIDDDTVVLQEAVTNSTTVLNHLPLTEPGSYHTSSGSGLGWSGGSPIGVKLAAPERDVVALVGDGTYITANPLASLWVAVAEDTPFLTVVYNNSGWGAVRGSVALQHPDGKAMKDDVPESKFDLGMDFAEVAEFVGAYSAEVTEPTELASELEAAMEAVRDGTPAVVDVKVESI